MYMHLEVDFLAVTQKLVLSTVSQYGVSHIGCMRNLAKTLVRSFILIFVSSSVSKIFGFPFSTGTGCDSSLKKTPSETTVHPGESLWTTLFSMVRRSKCL